MRNTKRILSMVLVLCMLLTVLSLGAFAVDISQKPDNGTTKGQPFASGTGGSTNFRIPGIVTLNDGTVIAVCDARWNHSADSSGLDTIVSVSKDNGENWTYTFANYLGDNGNVFNSYSSCIIDPSIATDGTTAYLIADLFPAGMAINTSAYRAQQGSTGYDANGNLLLRSDEENGMTFGSSGYDSAAINATYGYYLADGKIWTTEGAEVEGYSVDAYFNITGNGVNTNLFFGDSPYKPFPTDYLYMTTTTDGLNWSEPTLLKLKEADEQTLLVGPGNGTYDAVTGRMVFTAYDYTWGYQRACLIWRETDGTWHRSEDATLDSWSSEASVVALDDGTLRCFYRDGYSSLRYTDFVWSASAGNYVRDADATEVNTTATKTTNNQLTAIKYSEQINGKDAILVAAANGGGGNRRNGCLNVFLVNDDNSMELAYVYDIFPGEDEYYAYNCISEMDDGSIALLYESQSAAITFVTIDMDDVTARENDPRLTFKDVTVLTNESVKFTDNSGNYENADLGELDTAVAAVTMTGTDITTNAAQILSSGANVDLDALRYTFTANDDGSYVISNTVGDTTVYLNHYLTTNNNVPNLTTAGPVVITEGTVDGMFRLESQVQTGGSGVARGLHFHAEAATPYWNRCGNDTTYKCQEYLFRKAEAGEQSSTHIPGYVQLTGVDEIQDGGQYLIAAKNDAGNWFVLNPALTTTALDHIAQIVGSTTVSSTDITIAGVGEGYTEVQIGSTVYRISVKDKQTVALTIPVGSSVTEVIADGNYSDADLSALDTSVATVAITGSDGTNASGVALTPSTSLVDGTYVIMNTRAAKLVNNTAASAAAAAGAGSGRELAGTVNSFNAETAVWTVKAVSGGYTVQDANGQYLKIGSTTADMVDDPQTLQINYNGSTWTLAQNGAYLNHFGGGSSTCAAGWQDGSAAGDAGSQFAIYAYGSSAEAACTTITFTGIAPGETSVTVDRVQYNITVTGNILDLELNEGETYTQIIGAEDDFTQPDASVATAELGTGLGAQLSDSEGSYNGGYVSLDKLLYTFDANENGTWTVSGTDTDGTKVYLQPYSDPNGYPNVKAPVEVTVGEGFDDNTVTLSDTKSGKTGYLFFWRDGKARFDRVDKTAGFESGISFQLYYPADGSVAAISDIDGYVLVEDPAEIEDGGQYLIVAKVGRELYVVRPSAAQGSKSAQMTHLVYDAPAVVVTAAGEGETTFRIGSTIINLTVTHTHKYNAVVTEPTCTEGGHTTYTCSCGDSYKDDETPALNHVFENGICTGCGLGVAYNKDTAADYTTLAEALAKAEAGQTVMLLADCTENRVLVTPGVSLDLNGKNLTAIYLVGFNSSNVVDTVGTGKLIAAAQNVVLDEGNSMVPIYDEDGYIFTKAGVSIKKDAASTAESFKLNAVAYPTNDAVVGLLADGAADNDLQVMILLTWNTDDGVGSQKFVFTDEVVSQVYSSKNSDNWMDYGKMFSMTITGFDKVEGLHADIALISGTNVQYVSTNGIDVK